MDLQKHKQEWEDLANLDPLWAIITETDRKFGKWKIDEFLKTGEREIEQVMECAKALGYPTRRDSVLDFGCGVGRLTRFLASHFQHSIGVDMSERMISKARELNPSISNCQFIVNPGEHLQAFSDNYFDMVYSIFVLQHISSRRTIESYLSEFVRVLKENGLLIFQLPNYIPLKNRIQPRRRLYSLLRKYGINEKLLYEKLSLHPICANFIPEKEVVDFLKRRGAEILKVQVDPLHGRSFQSRTYFVTK